MSVQGDWKNSFGSVMSLRQDNYGGVIGFYTSSTGSSGKYFVLGYTDPNPANGVGQSLALSIFWRSILGGKGDPSWHYVSGLCGQCITLDNVRTLSLIHDMVATTPLPGYVPVTGNFMDKLLYTPYFGEGQAAAAQWPPQTSEVADPVNQNWVCVQNPAIRLSLTLRDQNSGYMTGSLQTATGTVVVAGFTDSYAVQSGLSLQGVTLCALLPDGHSVVSLAGSLNLQQNVMTLAWFQGVGTKPELTWVETNMQSLTFTRG